MPVFVTGVVGDKKDWTLKESGLQGVSVDVLEMGQKISVSFSDADLIPSARQLARGSKVSIPVEVKLDTYNGGARLKYRASGKPATN